MRLLIIFFAFKLSTAFAQVPDSDFSLASTACLNQILSIANTSTNGEVFEWDFCADDFSTLKVFGNVVQVGSINYGTGLKLVEDNGQWIGFALGTNSDKLFRLDFGNSPLNIPTVVDLGDALNILLFPQGIELVKQNGLWFGFVTNNDNGMGVILLSFGTSLMNLPTAQNLGGFGTVGRIWDVKVVKMASDFVLVFAERNSNKLVRVNFRDSFSNSTVGFIYTSTLTGPNVINGLDVAWTGSTWKVLVASYGTNEIYQFDFGNNLLGVPTVDGAYPSIADKPYRVDVLKEADDYFVTVSGEAGDVRIFNYHDLNPANTPTAMAYTTLNSMVGIDAIRFEGKSLLFGVGTTANLKQAVFESSCGASSSYSTSNEPTGIYYSTSGSKTIELVAKNTNSDEVSTKSQALSVSPNAAPDIDFGTNDFICKNSSLTFTAISTSADILSYSWSFGDTNLSTQQNPTHQYTTAGEYTVQLNIETINGCRNFNAKQIKIYESPASAFDLPSGSICTNNEFTFTNNTIDNFDGNLTYEWLVNDVLKSTARDFKYAFASEGDQQIKLKTAIPGCSNELTKTLLNVQTGPVVGFNFLGKCEDEVIKFTNESAGSISGFQWNFGNGNASTLQNPSEVYAAHGTYDVSLFTIGTNGCISAITKPVNIYSVPQTNFALDLPPFSCSGSLSQFNDLTPPMPDSNITSWAWSFGDQSNGSSSQKNPLYTYSLAGDYSVSLTATSNFGCSNSVQKTVTIYPSPKADFSFKNACVDQRTEFSDLSTGDIKSWIWTIQSNTYAIKNPVHIFKSPSNYTALLTVTGTNNCISQISKTVIVPVPTVVDFTSTSTCADKPTEFAAVTISGSDPPVSWTWDFDDNESGEGNMVTHTYALIGTYEVKLNSTRQSGCTYSVTNSIPIVESPNANFTVFLESGAAPFSVDLTNKSTQATKYVWKSGDPRQPNKTDYSPSFTYTELGDYMIELEASNEVSGCSDQAQQLIHVVVPQMNAAISDFKLNKILGSDHWSSVVTIENRSNVALIDPEVYLDISGNALISEKVIGLIKPNESVSHLFTSTIVPRSVDFACAEVRILSDTYLFDNRQCVNVAEQYTSIAPYPNPAHDELILEWMNTSSESMDVIIYHVSGQAIINRQYSPTLKGLNQVKVDVSGLQAGIYFVTYSVDGQTQNFKFSVVR